MGLKEFTSRAIALGAAAILAAGSVSGCSSPATESGTTTTPAASPASASPADSTAGIWSAASAAAATNTSLSAGQVTATIGGTSVTLRGAYVVDGIDAVIDGGSYAATDSDTAVFLVVNGGSLTITDADITKSGDATSEDKANFYGINSAVLVVGETSSVTIENTTITTDSDGSNAVVATGGGAATVSHVTIETHDDSSRGLHATYTGAIMGENVAIHTRGAHCATLATDRGNGVVSVTGTNVLTTDGDGSPLIYSTGAISASGVTGTSNSSQAVVIEGRNSATLTDSTVTAVHDNAVMLYQSFSGDAHDDDATSNESTLVIENSTLIAQDVDVVLYATNTATNATLTNVTVVSSNAVAIRDDEDRWGTSGSNGATLTVTLDGTTLSGGAVAGSSSAITVTTANGGGLTGEVSGAVTVS